MTWPQCHVGLVISQHKESSHEDPSPHDPLTSAHARRYEDSQLLGPHHRRLSALHGPVRQALWHLPRPPGPRTYPHLPTPSPAPAGLQEHLYPDRVCPAVFLLHHAGPSLDGG